MWYDRCEFAGKCGGLDAAASCEGLYAPLTEEELDDWRLREFFPDIVGFQIPRALAVPAKYRELLQFSNGGQIINGAREFGYFALNDLRKMYFCYGFQKYVPLFLPVALNGGGVFYAYDFRDGPATRIRAVPAGDLDYGSSVDLGGSLPEVLGRTENIEDVLDEVYPPPVFTAEQIRTWEIRRELVRLKEERAAGELYLKAYLTRKRALEEELRTLTS